jgi:endonuclease/exonuclease/phosphatase family metal-dependent hydrolase
MDSSEYTFPSDRPVKTIDYIGVSKNKPARVVEHRVLPETFPSDHRSIWAEIQIAGSAKRNNK